MVNTRSFYSSLALAQTETIKQVDSGIDTLSKLAQAGPTVLALVVALGAVGFAVYMLRQNWKLREAQAVELRQREDDAKRDADTRLKAVLAAERERREVEGKMLREMLDRGHETTQALEGSTRAMEGNRALAEAIMRRLEEIERRLAELVRRSETT